MKKRWQGVIVTILVLAVMIMPYSAFAYDSKEKTKGTVEFNLYTQTGVAVSGVEISIYQVGTATYEGYNLIYKILDELEEGKDIPLNGITAQENKESAEKLVKLIKTIDKDRIPTWVETTNSNGKIILGNMPVGVYLAVQTSEHDKYSDIVPFLFYMPEASKNGWIYDVKLYPKVEEKPELPPEVGGAQRPQVTPDAGGTQRPQVTPDVGGTQRPQATPDAGGTQRPTKPAPDNSDDSILPDTGMLQWPVPILAGIGVALVTVGLVINRRRND